MPIVAAESDIALRDGSTVHVRPARPEDVERIESFLGALSDEARAFRFFSAATDLGQMARLFTETCRGTSLLAVTSDDGQVVGHGQYFPDGTGGAEIAFAVANHWQGRGIATLLLAQLAEAAAAEGVRQFTAVVMTGNRKMIGTFRDSGFPVAVCTRPGELQVTFPTTLSEDGRRRFEDRERTAAVAAVEHVLRPRSVAIVGASRRPGSIGAAVMANLVAGGFNGPIFPINPHASTIEGLPAYTSLRDVPEAPELAVVGVPAAQVIDVAHDCAAAGVGALVVLSAGFSEVGEAGERRQRELVAVCRSAGMRLVGPNCLGVINTDPGVSLNASFAPGAPPPGRVGFASQSGAFGIAALDLARTHCIGLSSFVSVGDKADLSGNDFLQYWEADERTDVIALYLESFGNPAKFGRIARNITAHKPVIAVKSGRSAAGQRAGRLLDRAEQRHALFDVRGHVGTEEDGEDRRAPCARRIPDGSDGGHHFGRLRGEGPDEDGDHRVHGGIGDHRLQGPLVVGGRRRGDHVNRVGDRRLGGENGGERRAGRIAEGLNAKAVGLAGVSAEDRRAACVRHDGNPVALRQRLAAEHRSHLEHLTDGVCSDHARVAEQCVDGRISRRQQGAGVG